MKLRMPYGPAIKRRRGSSLRLRLLLGTAVLAVLFMLALLPALRGAFVIALEQSIEQRLAADAAVLVSAARSENNRLLMPDQLPDEEFENIDARLLGFIHDRTGNLVWRSRSSEEHGFDYLPKYDGRGHEFLRVRTAQGQEFFVYDVEVDLLRGQSAAFSIVTMQPASDYHGMYKRFNNQLNLWLGGALLVLLTLLWFGLTWGFRSLRGLSAELDQVESGTLESLSENHPRELLRLTGSLNRLLDSERQQRERYRHSLDDLAHSLKTPLSVLQGVAEVIADQPHNREQAQVLQNQIERMSQQIGYQLQRASLRKSGLVRHRVRLAGVLDSLCEALDKVYRDKQVTVLRDFDPKLDIPMEQGALLELLGNLLENAYRLCLGQIRVSARLQEGVCELLVEDDGPGVPAHQRERILQRGERLDVQHAGQGIGTAVVKDIIESYAGELFLDDSSLGGAAFRMRLPMG
jgi:two-component system sensor histidine kinase PhoQ